MTPGELKFALEVETALNTIPQVNNSYIFTCGEWLPILKSSFHRTAGIQTAHS